MPGESENTMNSYPPQHRSPVDNQPNWIHIPVWRRRLNVVLWIVAIGFIVWGAVAYMGMISERDDALMRRYGTSLTEPSSQPIVEQFANWSDLQVRDVTIDGKSYEVGVEYYIWRTSYEDHTFYDQVVGGQLVVSECVFPNWETLDEPDAIAMDFMGRFEEVDALTAESGTSVFYYELVAPVDFDRGDELIAAAMGSIEKYMDCDGVGGGVDA